MSLPVSLNHRCPNCQALLPDHRAECDRFEWEEVRTFGGATQYIKTACRHFGAIPVESCVTGETVAILCTDCDEQLPAEWNPRLLKDPDGRYIYEPPWGDEFIERYYNPKLVSRR